MYPLCINFSNLPVFLANFAFLIFLQSLIPDLGALPSQQHNHRFQRTYFNPSIFWPPSNLLRFSNASDSLTDSEAPCL